MSAITSLLARDEVASVQAIEDALLQQVLEGGDIDTALLEGGALPENILSAYRAATYGVAPASRSAVMAPSAEPAEMLSAELAERYRIMPISVTGDQLTVASKRPLTQTEIEALEAAQSLEIKVLVVVEVRIEAALAQHYGVEISGRMRHLADDLVRVDPGPIPHVEPPPELETVRIDGEILHAFDSEPPDADEEQSDAAVAVSPVVTVVVGAPGAKLAEAANAAQPPIPETMRGAETVRQGSPQPAAKVVKAAKSGSPPAQRSRSMRPSFRSGPLSLESAREQLAQAHDRDTVVEVYFAYARQFFECTALFSVRSNRVLGVEASGSIDVEDITTVAVDFGPGSTLAEMATSPSARVADLTRKKTDQLFVNAIGRNRMQPCALIPIVLGKRVVSLLYGDREGQHLVLADLEQLLPIVPDVVHAFEHIIRERKLFAMQAARGPAASPPAAGATAATGDEAAARETSTKEASAVEEASDEPAPAPKATASESSAKSMKTAGSVPPRENTVQLPGLSDGAGALPPTPALGTRKPVTATQPLDGVPAAKSAAAARGATSRSSSRSRRSSAAPSRETLSKLGVPRSAPPPPARPQHSPSRDELERSPTIKLVRESSATAPPSIAPRPAASNKSPPGTGSYRSLQPGPAEQFAVMPRLGGAASRGDDEGSSYRVSDRPSEVVQVGPTGRRPSYRPAAQPPSEPPPPRADREATQPLAKPTIDRRHVPESPLPVKPDRSHRRSDPPPDARTEEGILPSADFVTIPKAVSESIRPIAMATADPDQPSIIVDMGADLGRLVSELKRCGPEDEAQAVESLLRLGEVALPSLVENFPGPLWFDRRGAPKVLPAGRDISAIARALSAFGARAAPYIAEMMASSDPDIRFYATLLAVDTAPASLLDPFIERAFDDDPQIRLMVRGSLPVFAGVADYKVALATLRVCAGDVERDVADRLNALEVLATIREAGSVDVLIDLTEDTERQLTVPSKRALIAITGQDFSSLRKWRSWIKSHRHEPRAQWLIESLMHSDESVRAVAGAELQKLTRVYHGFVASASKRERERVQKRYRQWLRHEQFSPKSAQ